MKIEFVYNSTFANLVLVLGFIIFPISISSYPELFRSAADHADTFVRSESLSRQLYGG